MLCKAPNTNRTRIGFYTQRKRLHEQHRLWHTVQRKAPNTNCARIGFYTHNASDSTNTPALTHSAAIGHCRNTGFDTQCIARLRTPTVLTLAFTHNESDSTNNTGFDTQCGNCIHIGFHTQCSTIPRTPNTIESRKSPNAFPSALTQNGLKVSASTSTQLWRTRVRIFPCIPDE